MLSVGSAFYSLKSSLSSIYEEGEAIAIAHMALEHITGLNRMERLSAKNEPLNGQKEALFNHIHEQLANGTPIQYALGHAWFMGRRFEVNNVVLIPRPETEELVQWIIDEAPAGAAILDIGTGSGCIPISLKAALPNAKVSAIDISPSALTVAKQNAKNLKTDVTFQELDFLNETAWPQLPSYDIIVSNPPYIPASEEHTLHPNVRDHEPATALFVPSNDALLFYRAIADFGQTHLNPQGTIYCELHRDYAQDTATLFQQKGYTHTTLKKDIQGAPRMLKAQKH